MTLQVLYLSNQAERAEAPQADIVAVHGLNGDAKATWTDKKTNAFWLKDFLPRDVPDARIMTFGYDATAAFGDTTAHIADHAKDLLVSLVDKREEDDEARRPIIFIGHSLGGIIIKKALFLARIEERYSSISESTVGIFFFGTPHRGSEKAEYPNILATIATTVMNRPSPSLLGALRTKSTELQQLNNNVRDQLANYQVCSFYEMKPMKPLKTLIVEKPSALLDVKDEEQIPVNANHEEMCKFGERGDGVYERVFKRVRRMMKDRKTSISDVSLTKTRMTNPAKRSYDEDGSFPHSKRARATLYSPSDHNLRRYYGDESDTSDDSDDNDGGGDSDTSDGSDDNDGGGDSDTSDGADDGDDLDNSNMGRGWQDEDDIHLDSDEDY